jgi:hypothetical protein
MSDGPDGYDSEVDIEPVLASMIDEVMEGLSERHELPPTEAASSSKPSVIDLRDDDKPLSYKDSAVAPASPAESWATVLTAFFKKKSQELGHQVRKISVLSLCTGMWTEGLVAEVHL